ncbi:MAG: protein kinase [Planctomycetes bacterium]|nr:protein kinase [Planctomycetota bacterium]
MELVRGVPITDFCDEGNLNTRERLKLLAQVCRAVQHAHQKGIIHRDIKPGNVLVTMHDDHPVPKVIDFGVAKATNQQLTEQTLLTNFAQMIGTPLYMSPEQAQMNELDVDTRSDVYSLGVLLYELLTGSTPFDSQALKDAGYDEMRRIIREDEPPKPSDRISTLAAEALSTVSEKRRHDPRRLSQSLKGELDWIVLRAMEKDRTRRYESASDLAADIERYLNDEPVEACPPSWVYRTRKFVRRHKAALTTTALVAAALLIGTAVSAWQAVEANAARDAEAAQREEADAQREVAEQQQKQAEDNLQTAMEVVNEMYQLASRWLASDTEATNVQRHFLVRAEEFYRAIVAKPEEYRLSPSRLAEIHRRIGLINYRTRKFEKAATSLAAAIAIQKTLLVTEPNDVEVRSLLAEDLNVAGVVYNNLEQPDKAEASYQAAQRNYRQLAEQQPSVADHRLGMARAQSNLANLLSDQNRLAEAEQLIRDAQQQYSAAGKDLRRLGGEFNSLTTSALLASVLRKQQKYDEATKVATAALGRCEARLVHSGDDRVGRNLQMTLHGGLAAILIAQEQYETAEPHLRRQLQVHIKLLAVHRDPYTFSSDSFFRKDPDLAGKEQPDRWGEWVEINLRLALTLRKLGRHRDAEIVMGPTLSIAIYLSVAYQEELKYRVMAANAHAEAALLLAPRWPDESRGHLIEAVRAWRWAAKDFAAAAPGHRRTARAVGRLAQSRQGAVFFRLPELEGFRQAASTSHETPRRQRRLRPLPSGHRSDQNRPDRRSPQLVQPRRRVDGAKQGERR